MTILAGKIQDLQRYAGKHRMLKVAWAIRHENDLITRERVRERIREVRALKSIAKPS